MEDYNKIVAIGRVVETPYLHHTSHGKNITEFRIVNERLKRKDALRVRLVDNGYIYVPSIGETVLIDGQIRTIMEMGKKTTFIHAYRILTGTSNALINRCLLVGKVMDIPYFKKKKNFNICNFLLGVERGRIIDSIQISCFGESNKKMKSTKQGDRIIIEGFLVTRYFDRCKEDGFVKEQVSEVFAYKINEDGDEEYENQIEKDVFEKLQMLSFVKP